MFVIHPPASGVSLFGHAGLVRRFTSKADALAHLGYSWIDSNVGAHFREFKYSEYLAGEVAHVCLHHPYVMRDDEGQPLVAWDFRGLLVSKLPRYRYSWAFHFWNGDGPVPYAGRRGNYQMFRHPGTHGLRRDAISFKEEGEPAVRAKRAANNLQTAWDDICRTDCESRCWKDYRKTQWRRGG